MSMSATASAAPSLAPAGEDMAFALFRPHLFFYRPWEGSGEMFGPRGNRVAGFTVSGDGRVAAGEDRIVQNWVFDNGYSHRLEWRILSTNGADYRAIDVDTGAEARGRQIGDNAFLWVLKVKGRTPLGQRLSLIHI